MPSKWSTSTQSVGHVYPVGGARIPNPKMKRAENHRLYSRARSHQVLWEGGDSRHSRTMSHRCVLKYENTRKRTRMDTIDSGTMPNGCSETSRESGRDLGAMAARTFTTSITRLRSRTYEKNTIRGKLCLFEMKDSTCENFVSGVRQLVVLVISSSTG